MTIVESPSAVASLLRQATRLEHSGKREQAEALCVRAVEQVPGHPEASLFAARLATARGDFPRATELLQRTFEHYPDATEPAVQLALALAAGGNLSAAIAPLEHTVQCVPEHHYAWLLLGTLRNKLDDERGALEAHYQAITRAHRAGQWLDQSTTPAELLPLVIQAIERVRQGRRNLFFGAFSELRRRHGNDALKRMDAALTSYLDGSAASNDIRQRPKFFYFPGLPSPAYHNADLVPWTERLRAAFPSIRAEALGLLSGAAQDLPDFIGADNPASRGQYLDGNAAVPTWQAFFFYRHGQRFDVNHVRCPITSGVLESLDLCRIADQAPEICFSVLRPQTRIKPHHGATNTRLVMHLPLIVPPDCALNLVDRGVHEWREGEPVLFDDTFLHEAWNRSDSTRVILLMDCWNPHLTPIERLACAQLVEMISSLTPKRARAGNGSQVQ